MPGPAGSSAHAGGTVPPVHLVVRLELADKPPREFSYDFRQEVISLGRDPGNDIQIPLTTVSRQHARLFYELGDYFLEDLGSTHGTTHNGRRLQKREKKLLRDGDKIEVMTFSIVFKTTSARMLDRQPGEKTEQLARRMVQEVLASLGGTDMDPTSLRIMNGVDEGKRHEINEDQAEIVLGRSPDCDIVLDDQNASRRHCLIKRTWNGFTAQDLGSKNGVLVNGDRIEGTFAIKDGDEVQVGGVKLTFIDPASRILDQFGGFGEDTIQPGTAQDLPSQDNIEAQDYDEEYEGEEGEEDYGGDDGDGDGDEEDYSSGDEESYDEGSGEMASEGDDEEEASGEAALDGEGIPQTTGIGAEVVILILGMFIFAGAVGLAIFLYL